MTPRYEQESGVSTRMAAIVFNDVRSLMEFVRQPAMIYRIEGQALKACLQANARNTKKMLLNEKLRLHGGSGILETRNGAH